MNCDNCDQHIKGPPFGAIEAWLCWECYSQQILDNDERREVHVTFEHAETLWQWSTGSSPSGSGQAFVRLDK
jgi:hypothetical protein